MLLRSLHIASRQLFYLAVVLIILGLLALIGAMWLSEQVADREDEIAAWASDKTGYPVNIEQAGLYWYDLIPKLEVRGIILQQKDRSAAIATVGQMYLSLDILQTLQQGEPVVADASIDQARLAVERSSDGKWHLTGLEKDRARRGQTSLPEVTRWLSWLRQLELTDIQLAVNDQFQPALSGSYQLQQLQLDFSEGQWQADARIIVPEKLGTGLTLQGRATIDEDYRLIDWRGSVETAALALPPLLETVSLRGLHIAAGEVAGRATVSYTSQGQLEADADLEITELSLDNSMQQTTAEPVVFASLQGRLNFSKTNASWQLQGDNMQITGAEQPWPVTAFRVQHDQQGEIALSTDYLRLSDITALALLMQDMPDWLVSAQPAGDIYDLTLRYQPEQGIQAASLRAEQLAVLPWQTFPGVNSLGFQLDWQQNQVELTLDSQQTTVYAEGWLDEAVFLDSIKGQLNWQQKQDDWSLSAKALQLWNEDLNLSLNGRVEQVNQQIDTDLRLDLQDVSVNHWRRYVPKKIIPEDFEEWSRDAFREGLIRSGYIEMQGNPAAFPFDESPEKGRFDMQLEVENTHLHYAEGWPDIKQVDGTITGQGNNLLIESQSGTIAGFKFNQVKTTIDNLVRPKPVLRVDGLLNGTTPDALAFLQNSPLKQRFGQVADWLQTSGSSDISLQLMVPLVNPDNTQANGHVTFADSALSTSAVPGLKVTAINGKLNFDNNGVSAEAITAKALEQNISVDVKPESGQTAVVINGRAGIPALRQQWPEFIPAFVSGESAYQARVAINEPEPGQFDVAVNVHSDLAGIAINTPSPLGKTANQPTMLRLNIDNRDQTLYRLSLDNWLKTALSFSNDSLNGEVRLGGEAARAGGQGLRINGRLEQLNLDEWLDWQSEMPANTAQSAIPVSALDVRIQQLQIARQKIKDIAISASQTAGQWQIGLNSTQIKGDIQWPHTLSNQRPLNVELAHLRLDLEQSTDEVPASESELWPPLRLEINELELDDIRLGQLSLRANQQPDSWVLESASLTSPVLQASINGRWSRAGTVDQSRFEIVASSDDLQALLAYYGYQEVIEANQVQLNSQLNWPGAPGDFSLASMQGDMALSVGRGSLIEVEPGAAGRIFGLLSIAAIPRRLALDFSDLFGKGFDFRAISGDFSFANGIARTSNLVMQGDSALIEVTGPINLVERSYDQIVKVTPKVSSTLPLAGAVAGGPVGLGVGTAILLFDKLAGDIFDRELVNLISYSYQLSGPWENPRLKVLTPDNEQRPINP
jgi:uncharacterized protein (TIGR02099 family)